MNAGIYIHIPFCKTRCAYCAFYSQTKYTQYDHYVNCILKEAETNTNFLNNSGIETVYIGGGTPSVLPPNLIAKLLNRLNEIYNLQNCKEITIEVNPDDIDTDWINYIKDNTPINRISIGVQSFNDDELKTVSRRHNAKKAINALKLISTNFDNFSLDLIYGLPTQTLSKWINSINIALQFNPKHISAYALSIEPNTPISRLITKKEITLPDEEFQIECYYKLIEILNSHNYIHYEISNYCQQGYHSLHNSHYWEDYPYIGLGASAHSYNGIHRKWNISSINNYVAGIDNNTKIYEQENIDQKTKYNEYIMLHLRTNKGVELSEINKIFGQNYYNYTLNIINKISNKYIQYIDNKIVLNDDGLLFADGIATNFVIL